MFKELAPYLRQRAVLLTVTRLEDDQISVNIIPKKLGDGENTALTTPFKLTGTAEELDRDLPSSIVDFVASHLQLKSTLERAKAEMDAAGKAAQAEARAKKLPAKKDPLKEEPAKPVAAVKPVEVAKPEPPKTFSLFDTPAAATRVAEDVDEEEEILAEAAEDQPIEEDDEELDEAA
jgi:PRTRC genetic system protein E